MTNMSSVIMYLKNYDGEEITLMEVCGTHTAVIAESGIHDLISDKIKLISGPGCPVCVTTSSYVDKLVELAGRKKTCIVTFGDMMRVRGSEKSLRDVAAEGADVRLVYSPMEILEEAKHTPDVTYILAAVGFETTIPAYAIFLDEAINRGIHNVRLLTAMKTMPEAIEEVYNNNSNIGGFIAPGNVNVITGSDMFIPLAEKLGVPFVVSGFTPEQILLSIYLLIMERNHGTVRNVYFSAVNKYGNSVAREKVKKYMKKCDATWRGIGTIKNSGMMLKDEYARYDAGSVDFTEDNIYNKDCCCGKVVSGAMAPIECPLYGKVCTPETPQGACMVSMEGACNSYYTGRI